MKQFKFQKLNTIAQAIPLGIAIILIGISFFEILDKEPSKINKICKLIAYFIIAVHFIQTLWYTYYVSYNKKGITFRLSRNILQERTFQFKHLENISEINGLITFKYRTKHEEINLKEFQKEDINKIVKILKTSGNL